MKSSVQPCGSACDKFDIVTDVKQGYFLVTILFSLYLTAIPTVALQDSGEDRAEFEDRPNLAKSFNDMRAFFTDDSAMFTHIANGLQQLATTFASTASKFRLDANTGHPVPLFTVGERVALAAAIPLFLLFCLVLCYLTRQRRRAKRKANMAPGQCQEIELML
ncbi:uncharacterized protein DEA37_0004377 [Paragonimus westermani]|uniref:Uncharacterized protein n=1 Tax=Paragonimus westermani TaxID=34504 RepID=A0A5J4NCE2_9TREM|nr:uncharacterized protein DEA37_0004377 [Paragonimus westermani]